MSKAIMPGGGPEGGEFHFYRSEDGAARVEVRVQGETVWLSLNQMAALFDRDKSVISRHIANIFEEGELKRGSVVADFATTAADGKVYQVEHFNLDVIISVGYRVKSLQGTQFRIWATQRLREYIVKGFTMDDARLKAAGGGDHFDELLARIRDIRSSERVFWRKVLDIFATSEDYDPSVATAVQFFQTVQNKMHWATHGQTAAEVIHTRADASKPNMGMTTWAGGGTSPRKSDAGIAKNYLREEEIKTLNLMVSAYLDFAELQAMNRRPMTMAAWIIKLDDFVRLSERDVLTHAGTVSHESALAKANAEYEAFRKAQAAMPQPVDEHFSQAVDATKRLGKARRKPRGKKGASGEGSP
jgi:hypothetical protein